MIKSFKNKDTKKIYNRTASRKLPYSILRVAMRKLWMLDAAVQLQDLLVPPGNKLKALSGKRKGQHSIRLNKQWRICFNWHQGDAYNVEITDYH